MGNVRIDNYLKLAKIFKNRGFQLYLVGGTVRDFLLHIPLTDMDLATNATPDQMIPFLKGADTTFKQFGYLKYTYNSIKFDITTLRVEGKYDDSRHPSKIKFVTNLEKDYERRDFTINAMYLDSYFIIHDFCNGNEDLKNKIIRFVGKPKVRVKEDPLRILRAIRFSLMLGFTIEPKSKAAMIKYSNLLDLINIEKIKEEIKKMDKYDEHLRLKLFKEYGIEKYLENDKN